MNNSIYKRLLEIISNELEAFNTLISADNVLGLNVTSEEILNYLEFAKDENSLSGPILGNVIITEGDILSILKIINDLKYNEGEYLLYINNDNLGTITYLVSRANMIYKEFGINIKIQIDYSDNYNVYVNTLVSIIGSDAFILESKKDFNNANQIMM